MSEQEQVPSSPTGSWVITRVFSASGVGIDLKASGTTLSAALDDLYTGIRHGVETYKIQVEAPKAPAAPAPKQDAAAKIAVEEGNQELADELVEQGLAVPEPPKGKSWQVTNANLVKFLPQPDSRVTVEFYEPNKKWPTVKVNKWEADHVAALMKHVTSVDVSKAAEYSLSCAVYWVEGKEGKTTDGKIFHWKDVCHVRPI